MLGIIFIYFLGKYFFDLGKQNDKNGWGYAILGIAFYYASTFVFGVVFYLIFETLSSGSLDEISDFGISLMTIPFGLFFTYLLYLFLKKRIRNKAKGMTHTNSEILDDEYL